MEGRPLIVNRGTFVVGSDFELRSVPVQSHLVSSYGGRLRIGDRVRIAHGVGISCSGRIDIDDDVSIGAFCMLLDSDFHVAGASEIAPEPKPIHIGQGAKLGHRVIVLPGSKVGAGAVVLAGSVVSGEVPAHTVVSGNPARPPLASNDTGIDDPHDVVPRLVRDVLGLERLPSADEGPDQISSWDSLGALRLIFALEERFSISLTEDEIKTARSIRDIVDRVGTARARGGRAERAD